MVVHMELQLRKVHECTLFWMLLTGSEDATEGMGVKGCHRTGRE